MTVKHSPGPFAAPDGQFIRDAQDRIIAGVVPWNAPPEECAHNVALFTAAPYLADAAEATLLFHDGGAWTSEKSNRWFELTGTDQATTKVLCDFQRAALRKAGRE